MNALLLVGVLLVVVIAGGAIGALLYLRTNAADADDDSDATADDDAPSDIKQAIDGLRAAADAFFVDDENEDETAAADTDDERDDQPGLTELAIEAAPGPERRQELLARAREGARTAWQYTKAGSAWTAAALAGTDTKRAYWRMTGAVGVVLAVFVGLAYVAYAGWGALAAGLFVGALVAGVSGPPVAIIALRDGLWPKGLIGTGLAIAAQIAFGKAALVHRADGQYEWTVLRDAEQGYVAQLKNGSEVPIAAGPGELYAFGFGKLAVVEQKTDANLRQWAVTEGATDGGAETRAGIEVAPPQREQGGVLVSLATIQRAVRGSASSTLVRRGRDKALDEEGGTGQLSELWTMLLATALLVLGFGMTAGVLLI